MIVNKLVVPVLVLGLLLGTVVVAQANGWWIVSGKEMVDVGNLQSAEDIKGWMSFQQVADGLGIDVQTLYAQLELPSDLPPATALKEMEAIIPGFEVSTVREVVAAFVSEAAVPSAGEPAAAASTRIPAAAPATATPEAAAASATALPAEPTAVPAATAPSATIEATAEAAAHTPAGDGSGTGSGEGVAVEAGALAAADIKGRHTLAEIAEGTGVALVELLEALGLPADTDPSTQVRDLVEGGVLGEIDDVRAAVTDLLTQQSE